MSGPIVLVLAVCAGFLTGLRAFTPPAIIAWATHFRWLTFRTIGLFWMGSIPAIVIFTVLAVIEIINDKRPAAPARTAFAGFFARIALAAFTGAFLMAAWGNMYILGAALGIAGAIAGTFGGYYARKHLPRAAALPDFVIAVLEDVLAIGGSLWIVSRF